MNRANPERVASTFSAHPVVPAALLDDSTRQSIYEMNEAFLALVVERHRELPNELPFGLRASLATHLGLLDDAALRSIAACPYTLFDMAFDDLGPWRQAAIASPVPVVSDAWRGFARMAAFFAWHLTRRDLMTVALVLGMTPATHRAWRGLPLSILDKGADRAAPRLVARWGYHRAFWQGLLAHSLHTDASPVPVSHLLGLQLLAADGLRPFKRQKELRV
jgi:hypothetical protein